MEINKAIEKELDKLGIYELRNLARQLDVASPTTKKREELLTCIKSRLSGEPLPENKSRAGRPAKQLHGTDNLLSNFLTKADEDLKAKLSSINNNPTQIVFRQELSFENLATNTESIKVYGVLRKTSENNWFFLNNSILSKKIYVIVQESFIKRYNLIQGDMIYGGAEMDSEKAVALLSYIESINGDEPSKMEYDDNQELLLSSELLEGYNICQGQCLIRCLQNESAFVKELEEKTKVFANRGYKCVFLGLEMSVQKKLNVDRIDNLEKIFTMCGDLALLSYEVVIDAIYHANAMFLRKKKIVLFVSDLFSIYSLLDLYFSSKGSAITMGHTIETIQTIKMLLGVAKCSNQASITVVSNCLTEDCLEYSKEIRELKKIANID